MSKTLMEILFPEDFQRMAGVSDDLTTAEAAAVLGIQANSVKRLCQRGILQAEKRGRDWFISQAEVDRYKKEPRTRGPKPKKAGNGNVQ